MYWQGMETPSYYFRILYDVEFNGEKYDFAFLNHEIGGKLTTAPTKTTGRLMRIYDSIGKTMDPKLRDLVGTPKPGEALFHTILAARPEATIYLLTGETIDGVIDSYNDPPGGLIELRISQSRGEPLREIIELSRIGLVLVKPGAYSFGGEGAKIRELGLELLRRGHVVRIVPKAPARKTPEGIQPGVVYDFCPLPDRRILVRPGVHPKDLKMDDDHDREVLDVWKKVSRA